MTGSDLRCPKCGAGAVDVAPDYELDAPLGGVGVKSWAVMWTCKSGHKHISGSRSRAGFEHVPVEAKP